MQVQLNEIRLITELVLSHLEKNGITSIEVTGDYYWNIPTEMKYDPYTEPTEFTMGQLTDDWDELQKILDGKNDPIGYSLVWLSSVLRYIGEETIS